ncbi:MAG TPA: peptide ABC transporter substrate-binding protein [Candidatus Kurthia intestinigallinarum]|uniref:peptide ABC transporter substrate-binding protein n=1 Tax=Kurthia sp. Dielmo TaxID=1033738 RepID=UPI0011219731|nr:peptide ABC transporter substrate-binding protein [Kurthia sp. Dielmo]HIX43574.1 peptide ABC transporter substrate-binding protein [Candidatus Kurthia intestinigallinarum]
MKKKFSLLALLAALMLVLAACGFGGSDDKSDGDKSSGGDKSADKTLNLSITSEPPSLNPQKATDSTSGAIVKNVFEGLTRVDSDGKVQNAAAEDVKVSDDKLTYTFTLRDAKWTNGDPVVAGDFAYAWKWALDAKNASEYASILYPIKGAQAYNEGKGKVEDLGIKVVDDKTLEVTLENPTPYFLELTAFYTYMPVNEKVVSENDNWFAEAGDTYVTNGPFTLDEWKHNDSITMKKNEDYWDKDNVALSTVNVKMIESEATANREFDSGNLDYLGAPYNVVSLDKMNTYKDKGILKSEPYAAVYEYKLNTKEGPTKNVNIRKALAMSIDREGLIKNVLKGGQTPALADVPVAIEGYENDNNLFEGNNTDEAKKYLEKGLKELGLKDASDLKIGISINTSEAHAAVAQFIQEGWKKNLGIETTIDNAEWQVFLDKVSALDYQVARMGWIADYNDAYTFLERYDTAKNGNNDTGWENKEYKELMAKAVKETDEAKRTEFLKDGQKILMDEMPVIPVYFYSSEYVAQDYVKNMGPDKLGNVNLKDVDIEK